MLHHDSEPRRSTKISSCLPEGTEESTRGNVVVAPHLPRWRSEAAPQVAEARPRALTVAVTPKRTEPVPVRANRAATVPEIRQEANREEEGEEFNEFYAVFKNGAFPFWILGYVVAIVLLFGSMYLMNVAANYTTMKYTMDGYDPSTKEWHPRKPLDDALLPSFEYLKKYDEWFVEKYHGPFTGKEYDYGDVRDYPFGIIIPISFTIPFLFGRLDLLFDMVLIQVVSSLFKVYIGFTWQTPPSQGKHFAVLELGGMDEVCEFREAYQCFPARPYWKKLLATTTRHASDMVYSGHTFSALNFTRLALGTLGGAKLPGKFGPILYWLFAALTFLAYAIGMSIMQFGRGHYSFDIVMATVLWYLLTQWVWLRRRARQLTNYFTADRTHMPPSVEELFAGEPELV